MASSVRTWDLARRCEEASRLLGQIHDSGIADLSPELRERLPRLTKRLVDEGARLYRVAYRLHEAEQESYPRGLSHA